MKREKVFTEPKTTSSELINYSKYKLNNKEFSKFIICIFACFAGLGILFYRSILFSFVLGTLSISFIGIYKEYLKEKRKEKLLEGFRDVLYSISSSVAAGRRLPRAIDDASQLCSKVYGNDSDISIEMKGISNAYNQAHCEIETLFSDFADRSGIDEIFQFAEALKICEKCGGDLEAVCMKSSKILLDKIDFQKETKALIYQKRLDIILLTSMPIIILIFLNLSNYEYISVLYETTAGRLIMSFCLFLIICALLWGIKIIDIKI